MSFLDDFASDVRQPRRPHGRGMARADVLLRRTGTTRPRCRSDPANRGMGPGERVAVWTADRFAFLVTHLGVLLGGGVSLPLNPKFTREEMRYFLADSGAAVVVGDPDCPAPRRTAPGLPGLRSVATAEKSRTLRTGTRCRSHRNRRPVPDPLQFWHYRPAERGCSYAG